MFHRLRQVPYFLLLAVLLHVCRLPDDNLSLSPGKRIKIIEEKFIFNRLPKIIHDWQGSQYILLADQKHILSLNPSTGKLENLFDENQLNKQYLIDRYIKPIDPSRTYMDFEDFKDDPPIPLFQLQNLAYDAPGFYLYYRLSSPHLGDYEGKTASIWNTSPFLIKLDHAFKVMDIKFINDPIIQKPQFVNTMGGMQYWKGELITTSHFILSRVDHEADNKGFFGLTPGSDGKILEKTNRYIPVNLPNQPYENPAEIIYGSFYNNRDSLWISYQNSIYAHPTESMALTIEPNYQITSFSKRGNNWFCVIQNINEKTYGIRWYTTSTAALLKEIPLIEIEASEKISNFYITPTHLVYLKESGEDIYLISHAIEDNA